MEKTVCDMYNEDCIRQNVKVTPQYLLENVPFNNMDTVIQYY